jgi:hypothetical protein
MTLMAALFYPNPVISAIKTPSRYDPGQDCRQKLGKLSATMTT